MNSSETHELTSTTAPITTKHWRCNSSPPPSWNQTNSMLWKWQIKQHLLGLLKSIVIFNEEQAPHKYFVFVQDKRDSDCSSGALSGKNILNGCYVLTCIHTSYRESYVVDQFFDSEICSRKFVSKISSKKWFSLSASVHRATVWVIWPVLICWLV